MSSTVSVQSQTPKSPPWLVERRESAFDAYRSAGLPDRVQHLWRYTDPSKFVPSEQALAAEPQDKSLEWPSALTSNLKAGELSGAVVSDAEGRFLCHLSEESAREGVVLLDLRYAALESGDLVKSHLGAAVGSDHGKFEALNLASWRNGVLVYVPRNVVVEKPIHLWLEAPEALSEKYCSTRVLVVAEEGASVTVIDENVGGGERLKLSSVAEIVAAPASSVRYAAVQRLGPKVAYHFTQRASAARDANVLTMVATLGGGVTKADLGTVLEGSGANVNLLGFLFGGRRQHFDHHTVHDHRAGHTYSDLDFKTVLKNRARSAYTGLIRIEKEAASCEAYQENRNLLLNDGCRAESIPELEILNEEVVCTHGATMGSLDPQHVFYLMSRGVPRAEAVRMIVGGFIEPTLTKLPDPLSTRLRGYVEAQLKNM